MAASARRERIKQVTRQGILDGARQIAQHDGWPALTIRKVADYIEYSPSIVYEYFDGKDDILRALLQDGFRQLAATMERAQHSTDDPHQQAMRVADAYWYFARDNRELYQVMHGLAGVHVDPAVRADSLQGVCGIAAATLVNWAAANNVQLDDPIAGAEIVWSLLHGCVSLTLIDGVYDDQDHAKQQLNAAVRALLHGWRALGTTA